MSSAQEQRDRLTRDEKWQPTHEQSNRIEVGAKLNNFCLDSSGQVLACCDDHKIRVYTQEGELVDTWDLDFAPQAIGLRKADGAIFVGGEGHLARLAADGVVEQQEEFPRSMSDEEVEEMIKSQVDERKQMLDKYQTGLAAQLAKANAALAEQQNGNDEPADDGAAEQPDGDDQTPTSDAQRKALECISGVSMTDGGLELQFNEGTTLPRQIAAIKTYIDTRERATGTIGRPRAADPRAGQERGANSDLHRHRSGRAGSVRDRLRAGLLLQCLAHQP